MASKRVQLLKPRTIEVSGRTCNFQPGEWVEVGTGTANHWIKKGIAVASSPVPLRDGCGVVSLNGGSASVIAGLPVTRAGKATIAYPKTLMWDGQVRLTTDRVKVGLGLLDTWQIAVPLCDYGLLAQNVGSDNDRKLAKAVVRDLRVPLYETGLMFVRRSEDTKRLLAEFAKTKATVTDERLAFLMALYMVKPLILALPHDWVT